MNLWTVLTGLQFSAPRLQRSPVGSRRDPSGDAAQACILVWRKLGWVVGTHHRRGVWVMRHIGRGGPAASNEPVGFSGAYPTTESRARSLVGLRHRVRSRGQSGRELIISTNSSYVTLLGARTAYVPRVELTVREWRPWSHSTMVLPALSTPTAVFTASW
jgi:hypothetical protein